MPHPHSFDVSGGENACYRGRTTSSESFGEPDTEVVVTDQCIHVKPVAGKSDEGDLQFTLGLDDITTLECDGIIDRAVTLQTDGESYTIPTNELDEGRFRGAIVDHSSLTNPCTRLGLDRYGICPCSVGTAGCLLIAIGFGLILSVFGVLLGVAAVGIGALLLLAVYAFRKISQWRGANVWERRGNDTEVPH